MIRQINANDVSIRKFDIYSARGLYDLRPHFLELHLYENIYRSAITGKAVLSDSHNIPYKLPIVG